MALKLENSNEQFGILSNAKELLGHISDTPVLRMSCSEFPEWIQRTKQGLCMCLHGWALVPADSDCLQDSLI